MVKLPHKVVLSVLLLTAPVFPAAGDEIAPARTPWKVADPSSEKVVRWVVEGCAAYPVTENTAPERSVADITPQAAVDLSAEPIYPIND